MEDTTVAHGIIEGILKLVAECPPWPQTVDDVLPFADQVKCIAQNIRTYEVADEEGVSWGLRGGRDDGHQYSVRHFCRCMLYVVEGFWGPTTWDAVPLSQLCQYCPDECSLVQPVEQLAGRELRRVFEVSPLLLSCFACLTDDIPEKERPGATATPLSELFKILQQYEKDLEKQTVEGVPTWQLCNPLFAPGPRILAEEAAARRARGN